MPLGESLQDREGVDMLEWIMVIAKMCDTALSMGKTLQPLMPASLTEREKELLAAASQDGLIQLVEVSCCRTVFAGGDTFDASDPAVAAYYLDAFISLCNRGLIIHHGDCMFRLTGQGFDIARKLPKCQN